jgi:hypothetical protein
MNEDKRNILNTNVKKFRQVALLIVGDVEVERYCSCLKFWSRVLPEMSVHHGLPNVATVSLIWTVGAVAHTSTLTLAWFPNYRTCLSRLS